MEDGEQSVFTLNAEAGKASREARQGLWKELPSPKRRSVVSELLGSRPARQVGACRTADLGAVKRGDLTIRHLLVGPEDGIWLGALSFEPAAPIGDAYLYVHGDGKEAEAGAGGAIEELAKAGHWVLSLDLRGLGEEDEINLPKNALLCYRLGRSLLGMRAEDITCCARMLADVGQGGPPCRVHLVGVGFGGIAALHAAFLAPESYASLTLRRTLESWEGVVQTGDVPMYQMVSAVHGALSAYDLPDLVAELGDMVTIHEPVNAWGEPMP